MAGWNEAAAVVTGVPGHVSVAAAPLPVLSIGMMSEPNGNVTGLPTAWADAPNASSGERAFSVCAQWRLATQSSNASRGPPWRAENGVRSVGLFI